MNNKDIKTLCSELETKMKEKLEVFQLEESDLGVSNKNFYTATEIRNIIPVSGLDALLKFLQVEPARKNTRPAHDDHGLGLIRGKR